MMSCRPWPSRPLPLPLPYPSRCPESPPAPAPVVPGKGATPSWYGHVYAALACTRWASRRAARVPACTLAVGDSDAGALPLCDTSWLSPPTPMPPARGRAACCCSLECCSSLRVGGCCSNGVPLASPRLLGVGRECSLCGASTGRCSLLGIASVTRGGGGGASTRTAVGGSSDDEMDGGGAGHAIDDVRSRCDDDAAAAGAAADAMGRPALPPPRCPTLLPMP